MKRVWVAIVILFAALAGVVGWQVMKPSDDPEPVYKGQPLTSWLKSYHVALAPSTNDTKLHLKDLLESRNALRQIGTNAIPTLLRLLRLKDSPLKLKLIQLAQHQHVINVRLTPASYWNDLAADGFHFLGTDAQSAAPALAQIASENISSSSGTHAMLCLANMGSPAKQAVLQLATSKDAAVRTVATNALSRIDAEAATPPFPINQRGRVSP